MISPKLCHCIHPFFRNYAPVSTHPFFLLYQIQRHKRYSVIVLYKMHIVQWADESRKNPACWLLSELPIKLFSTSATTSALLPPSPLIKSCSIISVLFLQYFLPLSNSDSTCSSNNSPNNNPAILAPQRPHLILGEDDGGGGGDLHQHLGQHLHHSGEQQPKKHHSFQFSLAIIWSLMCDIVLLKLPS